MTSVLARTLGILTLLAWLASCAASSHGQRASSAWTSTASFGAVDYAHPERHLAIPASLGDRASIDRAAAEAREASQGRDAVTAATVRFDAHVHNDSNHAYVWRPFERVIADGYWMWCADRAVALGTLLRAMGVPTVWVKSMEAGWTRELGTGGFTSYRGHVFLEVYVGATWQLFDPVAMTVYRQYDPRVHLLPGDRYAYDKGDDPYEMVMSMRGDVWRKQTRDYFQGFDQRLLSASAWAGIAPPGDAVPIGTTIYAVCHRVVCDWIRERARATGVQTGALFGTDPRVLALAAGQVLVLTRLGDDSVLPAALDATYAPASREEVSRRLRDAPSGHLERRLNDGTRVVLVYGRDEASLHTEIDRLTF